MKKYKKYSLLKIAKDLPYCYKNTISIEVEFNGKERIYVTGFDLVQSRVIWFPRNEDISIFKNITTGGVICSNVFFKTNLSSAQLSSLRGLMLYEKI
jgi:hypothetical protein